MLEDLNSSATTNMMEFKQVWTVVNTTKQEKENLTKKVTHTTLPLLNLECNKFFKTQLRL